MQPCESGRFQPGEGPSRALLRDCTTSNFAKVRFQLYLARHTDQEGVGLAGAAAGDWVRGPCSSTQHWAHHLGFWGRRFLVRDPVGLFSSSLHWAKHGDHKLDLN